jgi:hypothetical protein
LYTAHRRLSQFYHVLLRLLVPRHPPNALTSLTTGNYCSRRVATQHRIAPPPGLLASSRSGKQPSHQPSNALSVSAMQGMHGIIPFKDACVCLLRLEVARSSADLSSLPCLAAGRLDRASHFVHLFSCQSSRVASPAHVEQDRQLSEWARKDLNFRPRAYQARALTS